MAKIHLVVEMVLRGGYAHLSGVLSFTCLCICFRFTVDYFKRRRQGGLLLSPC